MRNAAGRKRSRDFVATESNPRRIRRRLRALVSSATGDQASVAQGRQPRRLGHRGHRPADVNAHSRARSRLRALGCATSRVSVRSMQNSSKETCACSTVNSSDEVRHQRCAAKWLAFSTKPLRLPPGLHGEATLSPAQNASNKFGQGRAARLPVILFHCVVGRTHRRSCRWAPASRRLAESNPTTPGTYLH